MDVPTDATICGHCRQPLRGLPMLAAFIQFMAAAVVLWLMWPWLVAWWRAVR
jgi:hypothetical protein